MPVLLTLQSSLQKVPLSVKPKFADSLPNPPAEAPSERAAELRNTLVGVRAQGCLRARARVQVHCDRTEAFRTVQRKPRRPFLGHPATLGQSHASRDLSLVAPPPQQQQ